MPPRLHDALEAADVELEDVRERIGKTLNAGDQELIKLRRVTWGSILNLALLVFAAYALIGLLGDVDLETFADALRDASWWWLGFAVVLAQLPRIPSAVSTMGAINRPLPLGPLTALQFAICYINLAIPSTAARVAVNIRFFQRFGVDPPTAVSAGAIDGVSGFVVQIFLFVTLTLFSDVDFDLSLDTGDLSGLITICLIALAVIVVAAVVVLVVPALRARLLAALAQGPRRAGGAAEPDEVAPAVRRQPGQPGALRGGDGGVRRGLRTARLTDRARADQHRRLTVRRAVADPGRDRCVGGGTHARDSQPPGCRRRSPSPSPSPTGSSASTCRRSGGSSATAG